LATSNPVNKPHFSDFLRFKSRFQPKISELSQLLGIFSGSFGKPEYVWLPLNTSLMKGRSGRWIIEKGGS
jgi:hypothetical protein